MQKSPWTHTLAFSRNIRLSRVHALPHTQTEAVSVVINVNRRGSLLTSQLGWGLLPWKIHTSVAAFVCLCVSMSLWCEHSKQTGIRSFLSFLCSHSLFSLIYTHTSYPTPKLCSSCLGEFSLSGVISINAIKTIYQNV